MNLLDRAVTLLPADAPERLALLPALGRALREAAYMERAEAVLAEAVERGEADGNRIVVADAAVALSEVRFQGATIVRAEVVATIGRAIELARADGDEATLARALTLGGKLRFWAGEAAAAIEDLEEAARQAGIAGDRAQEAETLHYQCIAHVVGPTPVGEALARLDEIHADARSNARVEMIVLESRARLEAMRGSVDDARKALEKARVVAADHGLAVLRTSRVATSMAMVELVAGEPAVAEAIARPSCEALEEAGELGSLSSATPVLVDAVYAQGRDEEALALSERWRPERLTVPEDVDAQVGWRRVRAKVLARLGDVEEAERLAREAVAMATPTDFLEVRVDAHQSLAEVLRHAGRLDAAAAADDEAGRLRELKGMAAVARLPGQAAGPPIEV
jgi:tetratricopeptide (TPR) repeat protein